MAMNMLSALRRTFLSLENRVICMLRPDGHQSQGGQPALAFDVLPGAASPSQQPTDAKSILDSIFKDGFMWLAVPKRRVSLERRKTRRMAIQRRVKWMTPKNNIIACLECGHWHEAHTICGNCYEKVKDETEVMRERMDPDTRHYNVPRSEVAYVYKGEEQLADKLKNKFVVEMPKTRPDWWPKNLLTKTQGR